MKNPTVVVMQAMYIKLLGCLKPNLKLMWTQVTKAPNFLHVCSTMPLKSIYVIVGVCVSIPVSIPSSEILDLLWSHTLKDLNVVNTHTNTNNHIRKEVTQLLPIFKCNK